jgi:hypothetical protein
MPCIGGSKQGKGRRVLLLVSKSSSLVLTVMLNVLQQVLLKNPKEPPVVFHWFPIISSTITYGIDPYRFFFEYRAKVCYSRF